MHLQLRYIQCGGINSLLAKLSAGDLIAQEAKYHAACKLALHNKARSMSSPTSPESNSVYISHGIALA